MKNNKIQSKLYQLIPGVYYVYYNNFFDMGMSFIRLQEYYESSSKNFFRKHFDVFEFMIYYTRKTKKNYFSYTDDYVGYNIPSWVIKDFIKNLGKQENEYPELDMNIFERNLFQHINKIKDKKYYLIAATEGKDSALEHEIAHALYYTNEVYKKEMNLLIKTIPLKIKKQIFVELKKMEYDKSVFLDEIQAHMSTGLTKDLSSIKNIKKYTINFKNVFKKYLKEQEKTKKKLIK